MASTLTADPDASKYPPQPRYLSPSIIASSAYFTTLTCSPDALVPFWMGTPFNSLVVHNPQFSRIQFSGKPSNKGLSISLMDFPKPSQFVAIAHNLRSIFFTHPADDEK